jgi:hypothetical protein
VVPAAPEGHHPVSVPGQTNSQTVNWLTSQMPDGQTVNGLTSQMPDGQYNRLTDQSMVILVVLTDERNQTN